jgi:hypothetical protein
MLSESHTPLSRKADEGVGRGPGAAPPTGLAGEFHQMAGRVFWQMKVLVEGKMDAGRLPSSTATMT